MGTCRLHTNMTLFDLQRKFAKNLILTPEWQRGDAWDARKKEEFRRTVMEKAKKGKDILSGCVLLYYTKDNEAIPYISDGLQRTRNSRKIYECLSKEIGEDKAEQIMASVSVPVLEMLYEDDEEAKMEFRRINQGTPLTPKEEARTILTDLPSYKEWDEKVFRPLHEAVNSSMSLFGVKRSQSRNKQHMAERDNLAMFLRYLTQDKDAKSYDTKLTDIDNPQKRKNIIEQKLVDFLSNVGIDSASSSVSAFKGLLDDEAQFAKSIWDKIPKDKWSETIQTITESCFSNVIHMAILRRNNDIPVDKYKAFIEKFMTASRGTSNVRFEDSGYEVLSRGDLSRLPRLQMRLNCIMHDIVSVDVKRKKRKTNQLIPGFHASHKTPFSKTGEGATTPKTAIQNLSDGVGSFS